MTALTPVLPRRAGFVTGASLLLPVTLAVMGLGVFTPTLHLMQDHFATEPHGLYLVNLLQSMPGLWIVLFSPVAGLLVDRIGRKKMLLMAMLLYAAAGAAPFYMESLYSILTTRCLVGICESVILTASTTLLCDYFSGTQRDRWLASQSGVASVSALLIFPLAGYFGARFGWHGPFLLYLFSLPLTVLVYLFCWEPASLNAATQPAADLHDPVHLMPWKRVAIVLPTTIVGSILFYATIAQNANALSQLGVSDPAKIGALTALSSIGVPLGTLLFWVLTRLPVQRLLALDFLLIGAGFLLMSQAPSASAYVIWASLQQVGCGILLPTLLVWATRGLGYAVRGRINGLWQGALGLGAFMSGAVFQLLAALHEHSMLTAFRTAGLVSLAAALLAGFLALRNVSVSSVSGRR